ncbi:GTPase-associated protein 1-related protein [Streptomyces albidoflavus]|uniref:GTPase-associated protein 1-related protein n=1 Tax=Streptomyces sp. JV186 TaxID=858639 RepID=UPI002E77C4D7|nr:GTPase-associated protein 1-related protein [Streptomyces sp. JV186]MEE1727307.1 GTPase-associated protein 1-related protein [Streptomyces sp. JV186]
MSLAQLHHTSSGPGLAAVSPGVPPGIRKAAEHLFGYVPPRGTPPHPTPAEVDRLPTAYALTALEDGSLLLSHTAPVAAGGPAGLTAHTHAVHLPHGAALPDDALPVFCWGAPQWARTTPEGGVPKPVAAFTPARELSRSALTQFAATRTPWLADFFAAIRTLVADPASPPLVVVERDPVAVARWLALAATALPPSEAHRLTFTTYTRVPAHGHRISGMLPEDYAALDDPGRYRVLDCSAAPPPPRPVPDLWARLCARVWLAGAPGLFKETAHSPEPGCLAAAAVRTGVQVDAEARAVAAAWIAAAGPPVGQSQLAAFVTALSAAADQSDPVEAPALTGLREALRGRLTVRQLEPLTATALTAAVRTDMPRLPFLYAGDLGPALRDRLASRLRSDIRRGLTDPAAPPLGRPLALLRIAETLGVDHADLLPELTSRAARAVFADPEAAAGIEEFRSTLTGSPSVRNAVVDRLDALAAEDPAAGSRVLAALPLEVDRFSAPHLLLCSLPVPEGDRVAAVEGLLRAGGLSPMTAPEALGTAARRVWAEVPPTGDEARRLLAATGSDTHRTAGTLPFLLRAAFEARPDDEEAGLLATDLLNSFAPDLTARDRVALDLLLYTDRLGTPAEGTEWVRHLTEHATAAAPLPDALQTRAERALAHRLLAGEADDIAELSDLARSGNAALLAAYAEVAAEDATARRLRTDPAYAAACFRDWSSHPGATPAWDETRLSLLTTVLRPVVRTLPAEEVRQIEHLLASHRSTLAEEFRAANQGRLTRLTRGLTTRGRRRGTPS